MSTKLTKLVLAIGAMTLAGGAWAAGSDSTATAAVNATVVAPIAIAKNADLSFGTFAPDVEAAGTVVIAATTGGRSVTGGAFVPTTGAAGTVASFGITGDAAATFSITLPDPTITLTHTDTTTTMSVGTLTAAIGGGAVTLTSGAGTGALTTGAATLTVGGTLTVGANQKAGVYSNGSGLPVTVAYN
jgi:hypothetical protein